MLVRLLSSAALAGGFVAAPVQQTSGSPVTTLKYKVGIVAQSTVDLTAMGAGQQKNSSGFTGYFTMTLRDSTGGGRALTVVLDSMKVDSTTQGLAQLTALADSAAGAAWHGFLTDQGRVEGLALDHGGPGAEQFGTVLSAFFPRGAPHRQKKGATWTDTLAYNTSTSNGTSATTVTTSYTAAGEGMYAGAKALTVNATSVTTTTASQQGPGGGDMQIDGSGKGVGVYYVTRDGRYLGGTNTVDSDMTITTAQAPVPIPLKAHTIVTVSSL